MIYYFDLGLFDGSEVNIFVNDIFPKFGIDDYIVHGFEACAENFKVSKKRFKGKDNIHIHNLAISNSNDIVNLYYAKTCFGHSVFKDKKNIISSNQFEPVQGVVFTDWLAENVDLDVLKESFVILRANIEGAEWYLYNELIDTGMSKLFNMFLGSIHDMIKVKSLAGKYEELQERLRNNGIEIIPFCFGWDEFDKTDFMERFKKEYEQFYS